MRESTVDMILNTDENISDDEMGEEKSSKIYNYDSSYFSKKMAEVDKRGSLALLESGKQALVLPTVSFNKTTGNKKFEIKGQIRDLHASQTPKQIAGDVD